MKRIMCLIFAALFCISLFGCGNSTETRKTPGNQGNSVDDVIKKQIEAGGQTAAAPSGQSSKSPASRMPQNDAGPVDIDLTKLSSTMVYSEVYNMMTAPDSYLGKRVRMNGVFNYAQGDGRYYFACVISDATACCAQGIEFVLQEDRKFPDDYPVAGTEITVTGVFDTYKEGENQYCQLIDAVME